MTLCVDCISVELLLALPGLVRWLSAVHVGDTLNLVVRVHLRLRQGMCRRKHVGLPGLCCDWPVLLLVDLDLDLLRLHVVCVLCEQLVSCGRDVDLGEWACLARLDDLAVALVVFLVSVETDCLIESLTLLGFEVDSWLLVVVDHGLASHVSSLELLDLLAEHSHSNERTLR